MEPLTTFLVIYVLGGLVYGTYTVFFQPRLWKGLDSDYPELVGMPDWAVSLGFLIIFAFVFVTWPFLFALDILWILAKLRDKVRRK